MSYNSENTFVGRISERFQLEIDKDWSEREAKLFIYKKIYNSELYDNLTPWYMEYQGGTGGTYVPLANRRPSVIYCIPKIIVDESTSMLFGESHFPVARCNNNQDNSDFLDYLMDSCNFKGKMLNAAKKGALGSVCIVVKVLKSKFYLHVLETLHLTPVFDDQEPNKLVELTEKRKVSGDTLISRGYANIDEKDKNNKFYVVRKWTEEEEIYYLPYKVSDDKKSDFKPTVDSKRSFKHGLGFVPAIWIKNTEEDSKIDGECTFKSIIDIGIEIDYQLSQLGRLLKYNSDPTLVIKDPAQLSGQQIIKGIGPITLGENGDAWMLEMTSGSTTAVIEYVRGLREYALELVRGNRANPDKLSAIHSGKALQMLNANLIGLVEDMRLTYGENGLKRVLFMMLEIMKSGKFEIDTGGYTPAFSNDSMEEITLEWPEWYPPTPQDDLQEAQALQTMVSMGILSKEGALKVVADKYNVKDIKKELTDANNDDSVTQELKNSKINQINPKNSVERGKNMSVARSKQVINDD